MTALFSDTCPEAEAVLIRLLRQAPPWRKLKMVEEMNLAVKTMMLRGLRDRNPLDSEAQIKRRMADLLLGPELAMRVYGPISEVENAG